MNIDNASTEKWGYSFVFIKSIKGMKWDLNLKHTSTEDVYTQYRHSQKLSLFPLTGTIVLHS